jgi:hypothetical protein
MPTITLAARDADIEKRIDAALEQERTARTDEARAAHRTRIIEEQRLVQLAEEDAKIRAARAAYLQRVAAAHGPACTRYKAALTEFRAARVHLQALDTILDRSGFGHNLCVELRHAIAAPDEIDINDGLPAAVDSIRRALGG